MSAYASAQVTFGTAFLNTLMAALKTAPMNPLVNTAKIRLNTNPAFNPSPGDAISTNTANEADYTGYTAGGIAVSLSSPVNLSPTCQGVVASALFTATSASPFVSSVVYGYWIDDGTNVILAEKFAGGINVAFDAAGAFLELIVQLPAQAIQLTQ
jgi:hypothetical protein